MSRTIRVRAMAALGHAYHLLPYNGFGRWSGTGVYRHLGADRLFEPCRTPADPRSEPSRLRPGDAAHADASARAPQTFARSVSVALTCGTKWAWSGWCDGDADPDHNESGPLSGPLSRKEAARLGCSAGPQRFTAPLCSARRKSRSTARLVGVRSWIAGSS